MVSPTPHQKKADPVTTSAAEDRSSEDNSRLDRTAASVHAAIDLNTTASQHSVKERRIHRYSPLPLELFPSN